MSVATELAEAHRRFEHGDLTRSAWILSRLLDTAPDAHALDLVEAEVRLQRRQLVDRAMSTDGGDLQRFDRVLEMTSESAVVEAAGGFIPFARVLFVLLVSIAGAIAGAMIGALAYDPPAPPPPPETMS